MDLLLLSAGKSIAMHQDELLFRCVMILCPALPSQHLPLTLLS
jgi:hypothetical protein